MYRKGFQLLTLSNILKNMVENTQEKIVYLFGAGATHSEMINLQKDLSETFLQKNGLLIGRVSQ